MTEAKSSSLYSGLTPFHILIVDDEATMRRSLADILRLEGYRVQTADCGEVAIQRIKEESFDLILLDLKMPGISGVEVLQFLAKNAPETQVILLTAHGSLESAIEALRLGARDYLLKPASPETILASVAKALFVRITYLQHQELLSKLENSLHSLKDSQGSNQSLSSTQEEYSLGLGIKVDLTQRIIWNNAIKVSLTYSESKLLALFLKNQGHIFSHTELVEKVQGYQTTAQEAPAMLRPLVSRLRQKLSAFQGGQNWIVNIRGKGYGFFLN